MGNCNLVFYKQKSHKVLTNKYCITEIGYSYKYLHKTPFNKIKTTEYSLDQENKTKLLKIIDLPYQNCKEKHREVEILFIDSVHIPGYSFGLGFISAALFVLTYTLFPLIYTDEIQLELKLLNSKDVKYHKVRTSKFYIYSTTGLLLPLYPFYQLEKSRELIIKDLVYSQLNDLESEMDKVEAK
jgi:hypothetical protein